MNLNGSFGDWLKQRRKALDLTQSDLADQVGCSTMTIRKIEADERRPSKQISERMADVLAISLTERAAFVAFARRVADAKSALLEDRTPATPIGNLPPQSTPFIGRENELAQIADRLTDPTCRLLTLVGPGGIGKTRLALQAASDRVGEFTDGVYFVSLTPVGSTTLIASAIASALQISFYGQQDPHAQVINYLRGKHKLLVMDNYEHLLAGIGLLADLLANAPRLKILATSRERLNMQEEWVLPVEGLSFPAQDFTDDAGSYDGVRLFVQTARRLQPDFSLDGNQNAVIDICQAVEGLPLGIELAATWLRAMPCQHIAGQIKRDLDFLATPLRNIAERHRSLRAVFEHSWALLSEAERSVVTKLSVFRGSIDLEAAEQVAGASLLLLAGLVDKSLIRLNAAGRYEMHELLRQFAADKLTESGEVVDTADQHLNFFLNLAEGAEAQLYGSEQITWLDQLEMEHDNFRTALAWSLSNEETIKGLHLAGALGLFWRLREYASEASQWYTALLTTAGAIPASVRAKALHNAVELEYWDYNRGRARGEEALQLARAAGDKWNTAWSLAALGWLPWRFALDDERSIKELDEASTMFREIGDQWGVGHALRRLSMTLINKGEFEPAIVLAEEALALARSSRAASDVVETLDILNTAAWRRGDDLRHVVSLTKEYMPLLQEMQYTWLKAKTFGWLALLTLKIGNDVQAQSYLEKCLTLVSRENSIRLGASICFLVSGTIAGKQGRYKQAATLLGAAETHFNPTSGFRIYMDFDRLLAEARAQVNAAAFPVAFAEGQMMTLDRAIAYALDKAADAESE